MQFKRFYTLYFTKRRTALIVPIAINSQFIRTEIKFFKPMKSNWYRAGYLTQIIELQGKPNLYVSKTCPLANSIFEMDNQFSYKIMFNPQDYLPNHQITFFRSIDA